MVREAEDRVDDGLERFKVDDVYAGVAQRAGERRVVGAGYRLAAVLNAFFP
jgi:hypothetical protein